MKNHVIVVGIILMLVLVSLCGCNEQRTGDIITLEEMFFGTWEYKIIDHIDDSILNETIIYTITRTFFENNTAKINETTIGETFYRTMEFWYSVEIQGDKLCLQPLPYTGNDHPCTTYEFSENNTHLKIYSLSDPDTYTEYVKIK